MIVRRMVEGTQVMVRWGVFIDQKKHVISHDRQEIGGRDSGEGQMRVR